MAELIDNPFEKNEGSDKGPRFRTGDTITSRLADYYRDVDVLSEKQQALARNIIKCLRRTANDNHTAAGTYYMRREGRSVRIAVAKGALTINGTTYRVGGVKDSVGEVICEGVKRWLFSEDTSRHDTGDIQVTTESQPEPVATEPEPEPTPTPVENEYDYLIRRYREIIAYLESHPDSDGEPIDDVSNATYINSRKMLEAGIPTDAILHAFAITWTDNMRRELEIPTYDIRDFGTPEKGEHRAVPYVTTLVKARVPTYLSGPSQAGKSYLLEGVAERMGLPFELLPFSNGVSIAWLFGRPMNNGYVGTAWRRMYGNGGVFCGDELDAGNANLLAGLNNAISNDTFSNPVKGDESGGEVIQKHPDFYFVAAGNTWGTGPTRKYPGRNPLDGATLERIRMGRVYVGYDRPLQESLLRGE